MNLINLLTKNSKALAAGILLSLTLNNSFAQNRSIEFEKTKSFEYIKKEAKKESKPIFIDCYTTWCGPCKFMDREVFTNDSVADFYNKNFVNMKMDMESDSGNIMRKSYSVNAFPTFLYFNKKGKLVHRTSGSCDSGKFIDLGGQALNPKTQLATFNEKYEKGERDSEFIYDYLKKLKSAGISSEHVIENYFKTQKDEDLISQINWDILFIDKYNTNISSRPFEYLIKNKEKFDSIHTPDFVDNKILDAYYNNLRTALNQYYNTLRTNLNQKSFNDSIYNIWKDKVNEQNFYRLEEVLLEADMQYNGKIKNWDEYTRNAVLLIENYKDKRNHNSDKLNEIAWNVYENVKDKNYLEKALAWAKESVELSDYFYNNDTYACLLYVLGDTAKAIEFEEKAVKILEKDINKEKFIKDYEETLRKMKSGEKLD